MQTNAEEISDDDYLYRRIEPKAVEEDGTLNSLAIYQRSGEDGASVDLERLTTPEKTMEQKPDFGLGRIRVGDVRRCGLVVQYDPKEDNSAHTLIIGKFSKKQRRDLAAAMELLIKPTAPKF